jgi:signal peptidase II
VPALRSRYQLISAQGAVHEPPLPSPKEYFVPFRTRLLLIVTPLLLILDQLSKIYIDRNFLLGESVTVFENFFHITYIRNKGAAFGILAGSPWRVPFFVTIGVIACAALLWYLYATRVDQKLLQIALVMVFSGAIGNIIDRVRLSEVIDFIDVHWYQYHWPAFNVADSAITVGVGLMILDLWREERRNKKTKTEG